ncbi:phosphoribosylglycinamide formyltransferase [Ferrimonas balearica]|uniref:phosphoribosylglycinamide formyltransferase n=1 Tax=Ferrimonas balearica TaxID=44012 RepID=UPI001C996DF2|nr:phosphoribosylglycinamide formyltransferase [Ferrimonas balearica]MBY5921084.1 phosphoribosylglycinamide formyltransferase [Ferrimonas balearica]MBY5996231.1 phosphoribosylglycinamide formyltransferase [Ferrimonas balearica]
MNAIRIAVLISGNGSNLQAILDACQAGDINGEVVAVVSNKADVYGLTRAEQAGVPGLVVAPQAGESREAYDSRLEAELSQLNVDLVVLAGFMRILSDGFVNRFAGRMLNIHPSLLPKYTGLNTHQRALEAGDEEHGCSVHFVTPELDGGPVILQAKVPVFEDDDAEELAERVHTQEHRIYPLVVKWFAQGRLTMEGDKALFDGEALPTAGYASDE